MKSIDIVSSKSGTVTGLSVDEIKALDPEVLFEYMTPLITKYAKQSFIPGLEYEDKCQELRMIVWNCQKNFKPGEKKGHKGSESSFLNYVIHAFQNRLGNLNYAAKRQCYVIQSLKCEKCSHEIVVTSASRKCPNCGSGRWQNVRVNTLRSTEQLTEAIADSWEPGKFDEYLEEVKDFIERFVVHINNETDREIVKLALYGASGLEELAADLPTKIPFKTKRLIAKTLAKNSGIFI